MNTLKTVVLMALLAGVLVAMGGAFAGEGGALVMLLISLGINFFSYWFSDSVVLGMYQAREVTPAEAPELCSLVEELASRAGLPMPKVCIVNSETPNAFATGRSPSHAAVAVTTGILRALDRNELAGVLAHELSHVKHRDTLISTVAASIAGVISMIAQVAQWGAIFGGGRSDENRGGLLGTLLAIFVAPLAASIIQMAISRSREYEADKSGGEICGNPLYLASALEKIERYAQYTVLPHSTQATAHLFIVNPLSGAKEAFGSLFRTHPPTAERIGRLREQAAGMRLLR